MAKVEFNYKGKTIIIQCQEEEKMEEIFNKFVSKIELDINNIYFLYSGNKINSQLTFSEIINDIDKDRKIISIIVNDLNSDIIKSMFPICKECKEKVSLEINNYKFSYECKNGHMIKMLINEYEDNQIITNSENIEENKSNEDKYNKYNNEINLHKINEIQLCPLCSKEQDKKNNLNNNYYKDYICLKHNELYVSYCKICKINICMKCQKEHKEHEIINYGDILPDKDDLLNKLNDFRNVLNIFNKDINDLINKLNNVKENFEILYQIYDEMINNYEDKYRNYEIFTSLNTINDNKIIQDIKNINLLNKK